MQLHLPVLNGNHVSNNSHSLHIFTRKKKKSGLLIMSRCTCTGQAKLLTPFKLNKKYTIFLCAFITKLNFTSKHFKYKINFLNTVSLSWRLTLQHISVIFSEISA